MLTTNERLRYQRQTVLPKIGLGGQEKLKNAKVLCVGAGGLGCAVSLYLAASGIGYLGLIDGDHVELSNLSRQILYSEQDCGKRKVDVAQNKLQLINPYCEVVTYSEFLEENNVNKIIQYYDLIVDCSDNFSTKYLINDACVKHNKPNVFASIQKFKGQLAIFSGKHHPCFRCLFPKVAPTIITNCAASGVMSTLPGLIGTWQATEVIKLILGIGTPITNQFIEFDFLNFNINQYKLKRNTLDCQLHLFPDAF